MCFKIIVFIVYNWNICRILPCLIMCLFLQKLPSGLFIKSMEWNHIGIVVSGSASAACHILFFQTIPHTCFIWGENCFYFSVFISFFTLFGNLLSAFCFNNFIGFISIQSFSAHKCLYNTDTIITVFLQQASTVGCPLLCLSIIVPREMALF